MSDRDGILIVRMSAAGDIVHTLPLAMRLRAARPDTRLGWVVEDRFAALVETAGVADELFVIPRRAWREWSSLRKFATLRELVAAIRQSEYGTALDVQGLTKSALIPWLAGIPRRIGFAPGDGRQGRELSPWLNTERIRSDKPHVAERNADLASALGAGDSPLVFPRPNLTAPRVETFLAEQGLDAAPFITLNPGAGWPAKRWPTERFRALAQRLAPDIRIVVTWGGTTEAAMAQEIAGGTPGVTVAPETDLRELWALVSRARLFVGCDTGPLHMAAAVGVPTVALFGPTDATRNGPCGAPSEIVQSPCPHFPRCWKKRFRAACTCMARIEVDAAETACRHLLAATAPQKQKI